ncbi:MAG: hypothetical protein CVT83_07600, partial [Alphaproteobacteria bacterium HGW-Alphaproteobacteria-5]
LRGLGELILRQAVKGQWPEEAMIIHWAYGLQFPPPRDNSYVVSLMRSALGRRARDEGWAVELFRVARRLGPPPGRYVQSQLIREGELSRARLRSVREAIEGRDASPENRQWLADYHADLAEVEAIQTAVGGDDDGSEVAA